MRAQGKEGFAQVADCNTKSCCCLCRAVTCVCPATPRTSERRKKPQNVVTCQIPVKPHSVSRRPAGEEAGGSRRKQGASHVTTRTHSPGSDECYTSGSDECLHPWQRVFTPQRSGCMRGGKCPGARACSLVCMRLKTRARLGLTAVTKESRW